VSATELTFFFSLIASLVALMAVARHSLRGLMLRQPTDAVLLPATKAQTHLRPAEIAYLSSHGDISHVLLVMGADLVQRVIKSGLSGQPPQLESYEVNMWDVAKNSVGAWAQDKVDQHLPTQLQKDPVEYVRRISKLYNFFAHTVRAFVVQLLADPSHIRKYFRLTAIASIVADFSTAGYKAAFEAQFRANLASKGLLVAREVRVRYSNYTVLIGIAGAILLSVLTVLTVHPWPLALVMIVLGFTGGGLLRGVLLVVHLIPLYTEIAEVIHHLERKSWRLKMLRLVISAISLVSVAFIALAFLIINGLFAAMLMLIFHDYQYVLLLVFSSLILAYMVCFQLVLDSWKLAGTEMPSRIGEAGLSNVRHQLKNQRPLEVFKEVLLTKDYEPAFSEILAVYGIETLLLLA